MMRVHSLKVLGEILNEENWGVLVLEREQLLQRFPPLTFFELDQSVLCDRICLEPGSSAHLCGIVLSSYPNIFLKFNSFMRGEMAFMLEM